jgi:hypothetical protein
MPSEPVNIPPVNASSAQTVDEVTAEAIFQAGAAVKREPFDIPGAGRVWVHRISALEAKNWGKDCRDDGENGELYADARLIQRCVHNAAGKRIFSLDQVTKIVSLGTDIVIPLAQLCLQVNGMGEAGREQILKNSKPTVAGAS